VGTAAALALLAAALASIPVPVLTATDGHTSVAVALPDGGRYTYSYVNSIYGAQVRERHVRRGDELSISRVDSSDIRAVEYFRWDGEPARAGDQWSQAAPANSNQRLTIRITPRYDQRLAGNGWEIRLSEAFGDGVVEVSAGSTPVATALARGWRP